ncbi:MAG: amidohydrolase family protein [Planctomycetota bacterium]
MASAVFRLFRRVPVGVAPIWIPTALALPAVLAAQDPPPARSQEPGQASSAAGVDLVLHVGTVHTVSGPTIEDGVLVLAKGRIAAVGPRASITWPQGVPVLELPGAHAYPGLVDAWSRAFLPAAGFGEAGAGTDVAAGLDRFGADGRRCVRGGVTTAHVLAAGDGKWLGTGALVRPRPDAFEPFAPDRTGAELLRLVGDPRQHPVTRYKELVDLGRVFEEAEAYDKARSKHADAVAKYGKDWAAYLDAVRAAAGKNAKKPGGTSPEEAPPAAEGETGSAGAERPSGPKRPTYPKKPPLDPQKEALLAVAAGKVPLWIEAQRREELRAALRLLADEGLRRGALLGCLDGLAVLDELAAAGVGVVLTPTGLPAELDGEPVDARLARALFEKGLPLAIASGNAQRSGDLPLMAAACVGDGLPEDAAVRAITLTPAELLGIDGDVGSLDVGKRADVVVTSAPILRSEARVLRVLADGQAIYQGR